MEWNKLRVFYHVAKCGSFTKAQRKLNTSQPALSRSVQSLEWRVKHPLFHRNPRGLTLTKEGEILFEAVEKMFTTLQTAKTLMEEEENEPKGTLKVASTVALTNIWLIELIPEFLSLYPEIELDIIGHDEMLDMKTREADVSIRPYIEDQPNLIQEYLFTCRMQLYASPEYLEKYGAPATLQELDNHRIITFGESTSRPYLDIDWPLRVGKKTGEIRKAYLCINSSYGAARLAEAGLGIVALSKEYPNIDKLNLLPILSLAKGPIIDIYYVYPKTIKNSKRVKVFSDFIKSKIPEDFKRPISLSEQKK